MGARGVTGGGEFYTTHEMHTHIRLLGIGARNDELLNKPCLHADQRVLEGSNDGEST